MTEHHDVNGRRIFTAVAGLTSLARIAIGATLLTCPRTLPRAIGLDRESARHATPLSAIVAGREIALGIGALAALARRRDASGWMLGQALGDATDVAAFVQATRDRRVHPVQGALMITAAVTGAVGSAVTAGALYWAHRSQANHNDSPSTT